ncbi:N-acetylgalactosaminyltransferase 7-like isoform X2 [Ptychodera flava]|uniref:N-acetylgalactosaminyltransferase 7-like isoform X2 n=1 Tax=Ptychodera flava TaxID=63121 RepID=UPI00396A17A5
MRFRKRRLAALVVLVVTACAVYIGRTARFSINQPSRSSSVDSHKGNIDDVLEKNDGIARQLPRQPLDQANYLIAKATQDIKADHNNLLTSQLTDAVLLDRIGNYEQLSPPKQNGPGENGVPVKFDLKEKDLVDSSIKEYSFNQYISDKISLDRNIPDLRDTQCKHWHYPHDLPRASVIVVFHNEGWSTLLRTVHSILNRTPALLLQEVILVDDFSDKDHLKEQLEKYISMPPLLGVVKLIRCHQREGLISARVIGAKNASGKILIWLDAHCEVGYNWLPPLLMPIAENKTRIACPIVDVIDNMDFRLYAQGDGKLARGVFDWEFYYKRVPITQEEVQRRKYQTEPYRSPVMAGGLFAMDKDYFFELGAYDPGLKIWGGENYELSFKVWMCGGQLLWVPCSRVGHVYRIHGKPPYSFPNGTLGMYQQRNFLRVAEVWMDSYKDYVYAKNPRLLKRVDYGDISAQVHFRKDQKCRNFRWFMETVAYDIVKWYPLPPINIYWGEVRPVDFSSHCLDTMGHSEGDNVGLAQCHGYGGNQLFRLTSVHDLRVNDLCVTGKNPKPLFIKCNGKNKGRISKDWHYNENTMQLYITSMKLCLDHQQKTVVMSPCDAKQPTQQWYFREVD